MKTTGKIWQEFNASIDRGKNEEVGSMDVFQVNGRNYYVNKTGVGEYCLSRENEFAPFCEVKIEQL